MQTLKMQLQKTKDLAYILGAMHDGYLYEKDYLISISQIDREWLEYLQDMFWKNFGIRGKTRSFRNAFELRIFSKKLFLEFKELVNASTPEFIKDDREMWIPYVSGFFDAEGHCTKPETFIKTKKKKIQFHQNDKKSLEFVKQVLVNFGIKTGEIHLTKGRKCHAIYVQSKEGILKFANTFKPVRKRKDIDDLVSILLPEDTKAGSFRNVSQYSLVFG